MSHPQISTEAKEKPARWGQERRLEFIDFRLLWEGRINRSDLTSFFGISIPQASLDLARYQDLAPRNIEYDKSERVYLAGKDFKPIFASGESSQYLNQLLAVKSGMMSNEMSFLGWYPEFGAVLSLARRIDSALLFRVLRAIRTSSVLEIEYQSMSSALPTKRRISPHAIAYDGFRWHIRAYCYTRERFSDFVFARILGTNEAGPSSIDATQDRKWNTFVDIEIAPHPELSAEQRRTIELDFGMEGGKAVFPCREALLFYMLRRLRLENPPENPPEKSPQAQQIVLLNEAEIRPLVN